LVRFLTILVQRRAVAGIPGDGQASGLGSGLDGPALRLDHLAQQLAGQPHLGGAGEVVGGLVEAARGLVEPAGQLAQAQADGVLGGIQPGVEGVATADVGSGVAAAVEGEAAVDGQDGVVFKAFVR
jgi:hypothetical protein